MSACQALGSAAAFGTSWGGHVEQPNPQPQPQTPKQHQPNSNQTQRHPPTCATMKTGTSSLLLLALCLGLVASAALASPQDSGNIDKRTHALRGLLSEGCTTGSVAVNGICASGADCVSGYCQTVQSFFCAASCVSAGGTIANGDAACSCCSGVGQGADTGSPQPGSGIERCA